MKDRLHILRFVLLWVLSLAAAMRVAAQDPCEITCNADMPICSEERVTLSVPNDYLRVYRWSPGGATTNSITVRPKETTTYYVSVMDTSGAELCNNSFTVEVLPRFQTSMRQLKLTCNNGDEPNGNTAQIKVDASGEGEPFVRYDWEIKHGNYWEPISDLYVAPGEPSMAIGLKAYHWYRVTITDSRGCTQMDSIFTRAFPTPVIDITCDPSDTVYIQNPDIVFSFENLSADSIPLDHFFWTFENDITFTTEHPLFTYVEPSPSSGYYEPTLTVYDYCGCDTTYTHKVYVLPVKLKIPTAFTPNGDGVNDMFVITLDSSSETPSSSKAGNVDEKPLNVYYKSAELVIMNRWGRIVYHSEDYQNDWDGGGLSDGTYFYILKCHGLKEVVQYQGAVMIVTKSRQ